MVGAVGLLSVVGRGRCCLLSGRFPAHIEALETSAGVLLIGGLALTSCSATRNDLSRLGICNNQPFHQINGARHGARQRGRAGTETARVRH